MAGLQRTFISSKYLSMLCGGTVMTLLTAVISIADTLIAGILLGVEAVAGICLVLPVYSLASFFAAAFTNGVPILYTARVGAFRKEEADRYFGAGLTLAAAVSALMYAAILLGGEAYLSTYPVSADILEKAGEYLQWMKYAVVLLPFNELLSGMVFADGDEKISLAANAAQGLVKVALSVVLCRTMGVKGLAAASAIGFGASILISCLHFFRRGNTLRLNLAFSVRLFREIAKYGLVDASTYLFLSAFRMGLSYFVTAWVSAEALILVSVITLVKEAQILFEGIGEAITPMIGVYLGEESYPGVRKVWKLARRSLWAESLEFSLVLLIFAPLIVDFLGIPDSDIRTCAEWGIRMLALTPVFTCRMFLDSSYFILVEKIPLGILDSFLRDLFPTLPLAVLGGMIGGPYGMFAGLTVGPPLGYWLSVLHVRRKYGRENYALFLADLERRKKMLMFEFPVRPDAVVHVRDQIGEALQEHACPAGQINRAMLIFEELFMLIYDCNPGRKVLAECTVEIGPVIRLTTKDNGRLIDLTDANRVVSSLRAYSLSSLLEAHATRRVHFLVLSYNHNTLEIT